MDQTEVDYWAEPGGYQNINSGLCHDKFLKEEACPSRYRGGRGRSLTHSRPKLGSRFNDGLDSSVRPCFKS